MTRKAREAQPKGPAATERGSPGPTPTKTPPATFAEAYNALNARRRKFVAAYLERPNATRAAKLAEYSPDTAHSQGNRLLKNAEVKHALRLGWAEAGASAEEVRARTEEVMRADLADVCRFVEVMERPMTWVPLTQVLAELRAEIEFEEAYAARALMDEDQAEQHTKMVLRKRDEALRHELRLERDPGAKVWAAGPAVVRLEAIPDIAVAHARGLSHLIRKSKPTPAGLSVELYDAQHARELMGKLHGLWGTDDEGPDAPPGLPDGTGLEDASNDQLAGELARLLGEDAL